MVSTALLRPLQATLETVLDAERGWLHEQAARIESALTIVQTSVGGAPGERERLAQAAALLSEATEAFRARTAAMRCASDAVDEVALFGSRRRTMPPEYVPAI